MRQMLVIILSLSMIDAIAQTRNMTYRTVREDSGSLHYLIFDGRENCTLIVPRVHLGPTKRVSLTYKVRNDTIRIAGNVQNADSLTQRILDSHFVIKSKKELYDYKSGLPYVDKKLIKDDVTVVSIDGKVYKMKGKNWHIKNKLKNTDPTSYTTRILKGKPAYDKYGLDGLNFVLEIETKR